MKKDTPQSELLFNMVLYQKTSASGQSSRPQNIESMVTVRATSPAPAGTTILNKLEANWINYFHIYLVLICGH